MAPLRRIKITELNKYLVCRLCNGYFVEATTITECLHTFCKTCIVGYLEKSKSSFCPVCDVMVHKTKPISGLMEDKTLQDVVFKLVPDLFCNEMTRRTHFYKEHPEAGGDRTEQSLRERRHFFHVDDQISLSLEFLPPAHAHAHALGLRPVRAPSLCLSHAPTQGDETEGGQSPGGDQGEKGGKDEEAKQVRIPLRRYLKCPAAVQIRLLEKFIRLKYNLPAHHRIDIVHGGDCLSPELTLLDVVYMYKWTEDDPLKLQYTVVAPPLPMRKRRRPTPGRVKLSSEPRPKKAKLQKEGSKSPAKKSKCSRDDVKTPSPKKAKMEEGSPRVNGSPAKEEGAGAKAKCKEESNEDGSANEGPSSLNSSRDEADDAMVIDESATPSADLEGSESESSLQEKDGEAKPAATSTPPPPSSPQGTTVSTSSKSKQSALSAPSGISNSSPNCVAPSPNSSIESLKALVNNSNYSGFPSKQVQQQPAVQNNSSAAKVNSSAIKVSCAKTSPSQHQAHTSASSSSLVSQASKGVESPLATLPLRTNTSTASEKSGSPNTVTPNTLRPNTPNTLRPNTPNTLRPNTPNTLRPSTPNTLRPNTPSTLRPNTPNTLRPNTPNALRPNTHNTLRQPNIPSTFRPNTPNALRPNTVRPNTPNSLRPNTPNTMRPNTPSPLRPNTPNTLRPNSPNTLRPNTTNPLRPNTPNSPNTSMPNSPNASTRLGTPGATTQPATPGSHARPNTQGMPVRPAASGTSMSLNGNPKLISKSSVANASSRNQISDQTSSAKTTALQAPPSVPNPHPVMSAAPKSSSVRIHSSASGTGTVSSKPAIAPKSLSSTNSNLDPNVASAVTPVLKESVSLPRAVLPTTPASTSLTPALKTPLSSSAPARISSPSQPFSGVTGPMNPGMLHQRPSSSPTPRLVSNSYRATLPVNNGLRMNGMVPVARPIIDPTKPRLGRPPNSARIAAAAAGRMSPQPILPRGANPREMHGPKGASKGEGRARLKTQGTGAGRGSANRFIAPQQPVLPMGQGMSMAKSNNTRPQLGQNALILPQPPIRESEMNGTKAIAPQMNGIMQQQQQPQQQAKELLTKNLNGPKSQPGSVNPVNGTITKDAKKLSPNGTSFAANAQQKAPTSSKSAGSLVSQASVPGTHAQQKASNGKVSKSPGRGKTHSSNTSSILSIAQNLANKQLQQISQSNESILGTQTTTASAMSPASVAAAAAAAALSPQLNTLGLSSVNPAFAAAYMSEYAAVQNLLSLSQAAARMNMAMSQVNSSMQDHSSKSTEPGPMDLSPTNKGAPNTALTAPPRATKGAKGNQSRKPSPHPLKVPSVPSPKSMGVPSAAASPKTAPSSAPSPKPAQSPSPGSPSTPNTPNIPPPTPEVTITKLPNCSDSPSSSAPTAPTTAKPSHHTNTVSITKRPSSSTSSTSSSSSSSSSSFSGSGNGVATAGARFGVTRSPSNASVRQIPNPSLLSHQSDVRNHSSAKGNPKTPLHPSPINNNNSSNNNNNNSKTVKVNL